MWLGKIEKLKECVDLTDSTKEMIISFIQSNNLHLLPNGRYELDNGNYVNIFEYQTKESDGVFEMHKKFLDIHYLIAGQEKILWGKTYTKETSSYQIEKDFSLGIVENPYEIDLGDKLCVFIPNEPHKPGVILNNASNIKKAVFKISVDKI